MLGRYDLTVELFRSDVGALWGARIASGEGAGSNVAVRRVVTKPPITKEHADTIAEAAFAALGMRHEHVVPIVDVVVADHEIGIVSEYVEGEPLRALVQLAAMKRSPMPDAVALSVAATLLEALAFLHRSTHLMEAIGSRVAGLSSDGILIGADGQIRVMEVGVSAVTSTLPTFSRTPARAAYDAPEKLRDPATADARADVFTVGALLWEMLVSRRPFLGADYDAVVQRVLAGKVARLDTVDRKGKTQVSSVLADLVERALQADPEQRFQTATEMVEALRASGEPIASAEEVAAFVTSLVGEALSVRRRRLARATNDAKPVPVAKPMQDEEGPTKPEGRRSRPNEEKPGSSEAEAPSSGDERAAPAATAAIANEEATETPSPAENSSPSDVAKEDASPAALEADEEATDASPLPADEHVESEPARAEAGESAADETPVDLADDQPATDEVVEKAAPPPTGPRPAAPAAAASSSRRVWVWVGIGACVGGLVLLMRSGGGDAPASSPAGTSVTSAPQRAPATIAPVSTQTAATEPTPTPPPAEPTATSTASSPEQAPAPAPAPRPKSMGNPSRPTIGIGKAAPPPKTAPTAAPKKFTPKGI